MPMQRFSFGLTVFHKSILIYSSFCQLIIYGYYIGQVVESSAKFDMLLKLSRGGKEEKFKVEVHRNSDGGFQLNKMDADK